MPKEIAIIGGGPSGLMAADILSSNGYKVIIYERMPTFGRKFLMAGRGGLNISHSENLEGFIKKYGSKSKIFNVHDFLAAKCTVRQRQPWCISCNADASHVMHQLMNSSQLTVVLQL